MAADTQIRGPGRPPSQQASNVRAALITAARDAIIELGYEAASTKQIAERAGVNPAMINYYFGSKAALGETAFRETIAPLLKLIEAAAETDGDDIFAFIHDYMTTVAEHPWIPRLVLREVLPDTGRYREIFFTEFVARGARYLPGKIMQAQRRGLISAELDPRFAVISMASLAVFPYLISGVLGSRLGVDLTQSATREALTAHTESLLRAGLGGVAEEMQED